MSNKTHIPKWDPRSSFGVSEPKRNGPKYNFRKRGLPDMDERSCRTVYDKSVKKTTGDGVTWYQSLMRQSEDNEEPHQRRDARSIITNGRITRRVGMFRNAKQSSVVIADLPSAARRNAFREIERIVAPDDGGDFVGQSGEHFERRRDYIRDNEVDSRRVARRDSRDEEKRNGRRSIAEGLSRNHKKRREEDRFMDHDNGRFLTPDGSAFSGNSMRGANGRTEIYVGQRGLYDSGYKPIIRPRRSLNTDSSEAPRNLGQTSRRSQNDSGVSIVSDGSAVREQSQRTETSSALRRLLEKQERIIRTPGRDSTRDSTIQDESISSIPYPSKKIATRILAAMPRLSLRDGTDNRYAHAAQELLFGSITQKEDSDDLMRTMFNRTSTLRYSDRTEREAFSDQGHEYLFEPDAPIIEGLVSSSPPPTPDLEREFNQTVREEQFHTPPSQPRENDAMAFNILSDGEGEDKEGPADGSFLSDHGFGSEFSADDVNAIARERSFGSLSPFVHISPFAGASFLKELEDAMNDAEPDNFDFNMDEPLF